MNERIQLAAHLGQGALGGGAAAAEIDGSGMDTIPDLYRAFGAVLSAEASAKEDAPQTPSRKNLLDPGSLRHGWVYALATLDLPTVGTQHPPRPSLLGPPYRTARTRNPMSSSRTDGLSRMRRADRQSSAQLAQLPPRNTRNAPLPGPVGSVTVPG